jgi:hypothetical protein
MEQGVLVLPHRTSVERRGDPRGLTRIVGEHRGGETVGRRVGQLEGFFLGLELGSDDDGAEDLKEWKQSASGVSTHATWRWCESKRQRAESKGRVKGQREWGKRQRAEA